MGVHNQSFLDSSGKPAPVGLLQIGPVVNVEVSLPAALAQQLQTANQPIPAPVVGFALIDTGATFTAVDDSVVQSLGVQPAGTIQVHGATGSNVQPVYAATLSFPGTAFPGFQHTRLAGLPLRGQPLPQLKGPLIALIGRDVLQRFVLVYNGPQGSFTLAG